MFGKIREILDDDTTKKKDILLYYVGEYVSLVCWKKCNILPFFLLFETSKSKFWGRKCKVASVQFENLILKIYGNK